MRKKIFAMILAGCLGTGLVANTTVYAEENVCSPRETALMDEVNHAYEEEKFEVEDFLGNEGFGEEGADFTADTLERAKSNIQTYQEWEYTILEDGTAKIVSYTGNDEIVTIPSEIPSGAEGNDNDSIPVTELGSVFEWNEIIKSVTIPEGIKVIGVFCFENCVNLSSVTIPEGVTDIGKWAFDGCESLTSISIPKSVLNMEYISGGDSSSDGIFTGCSKLQEINVHADNPNYASVNGALCNKSKDTLIAYPGGKTVLTIPATVTALSDRVQHRIREFQNIVVETGNAFFSIENNIFYGNNKTELICCLPGAETITSLIVPNGITKIADYACYQFGQLSSVTFPQGLKEIGAYAFAECSSLKQVVLPNGVTAIGEGVFANCISLENASLPDSLTRIAPEAFEDCANLSKVTWSSNLISIGYYAFENCAKLDAVTLPESLTSIGQSAFGNCDSLKQVDVPKNVEVIYGSFGVAFTGKNLEAINVSKDNPYFTSIDGVLYDKDLSHIRKCPETKTEVKLPDGVNYISYGAFAGCTKLQKVDIPYGVTTIDHWAFVNCIKLQGMILPDTVTNIGMHAFHGCQAMKFIAIPNSVSSIDQGFVFGAYDSNNVWQPFNGVIKCMKDSYAESYAKEYGLNYEIVTSFDGLVVEVQEEEEDNTNSGEETVISDITLNKQKLTFDTIGAKQTLIATVIPDNATSPLITWESSNVKVATVKDGLVTATGNGTATITATAGDKSVSATVTVSQKSQKITITLNNQSVNGTLKAKVKKSYSFKVTVKPSNTDAKNKKVTWSTSNKKIATVKNGKVSIKKAGIVTITAKTADGKSAKVKLKASNKAIKVTKVKISGTKTMKVKEKQTLTLTITPATADNTKVDWSTSNKKVAIVNKSGKVTAKKKGTVTITAKAKDGSGKKGTIKIKVK